MEVGATRCTNGNRNARVEKASASQSDFRPRSDSEIGLPLPLSSPGTVLSIAEIRLKQLCAQFRSCPPLLVRFRNAKIDHDSTLTKRTSVGTDQPRRYGATRLRHSAARTS